MYLFWEGAGGVQCGHQAMEPHSKRPNEMLHKLPWKPEGNLLTNKELFQGFSGCHAVFQSVPVQQTLTVLHRCTGTNVMFVPCSSCRFHSDLSASPFLTCYNAVDLSHETLDSSDGNAFRLILNTSDNVFNLREEDVTE